MFCFDFQFWIENPRVPGSIPGRGTIIRRALNRNVRGFFVFSSNTTLQIKPFSPKLQLTAKLQALHIEAKPMSFLVLVHIVDVYEPFCY